MARKSVFENWTEADEAAWEAKYQQQLAEARFAFEAREGRPPRHSKVEGPPADWKRWCVMLDGVPVGSCTEFDVDEGWVQVWPLVRTTNPRSGITPRSGTANQRRLSGVVTPVLCEEYEKLIKERGRLDVYEDEERGEEVPGTDVRTLQRKKNASEV